MAEPSGREWTIGVEFDESSLLDRGSDARRIRKMTRPMEDPLLEEFQCQSISLSPLIPSSSGTWTQREREEDQRRRLGFWRVQAARALERRN